MLFVLDRGVMIRLAISAKRLASVSIPILPAVFATSKKAVAPPEGRVLRANCRHGSKTLIASSLIEECPRSRGWMTDFLTTDYRQSGLGTAC